MAEQKAIIDAVTTDKPGGMAEWARAILLATARRQLERKKADKSKSGARQTMTE
jgi:hypothetical protein